jgi:Fe-S cluster assembly iron-binding protein IscA
MLALTPAAVQAVVDVVVRENTQEGAGLRIGPGERSAGDETFDFTVESAPRPGDGVVEEGPARVFLDPEVVDLLDDKVLDAHFHGRDAHFVILSEN